MTTRDASIRGIPFRHLLVWSNICARKLQTCFNLRVFSDFIGNFRAQVPIKFAPVRVELGHFLSVILTSNAIWKSLSDDLKE